jgi:WD40 repeat protein
MGDVVDRGVIFAPDGRTLTAAGFHMDKLVGVFDVLTGKRVRVLAGHTEWEADATAISADGKLLASTGTDKQVLVWELATGKLRHQLKDQPFRIAALAFSPDSATLAGGGGDKMVHLWDSTTGQLRRSFAGHRDWVATLAFAPDGKTPPAEAAIGAFTAGTVGRPLARPEKSEWRLDAAQKLQRVATESGRMLSLTLRGRHIACLRS